jgi:ribosomal-protein-alanine N-acetyltransferase
MIDVTRVRTENLVLTPTTVDEVDALFPIFSDPAGWWYEPGSRHSDIERTRWFCRRASDRWSEGLSYWTAREIAGDQVVGLGGAQRHSSGVWNVSYRIATASQGRGYATEIGRAGVRAANQVDSASPVVARIDEINSASMRVAERIGLQSQGLLVDSNDGVLRLAYSDRPLAEWPPAMVP